MNLGRALGQFQYYKGKSGPYVEAVRAWVTPGAAAGAFAKYLGVQSRWSIVIAITIPILVEIGGFLLGKFLYDRGGVSAEYELALRADPFRMASLEHAKATREDVRLTRIGIAALVRHFLGDQIPKK